MKIEGRETNAPKLEWNDLFFSISITYTSVNQAQLALRLTEKTLEEILGVLYPLYKCNLSQKNPAPHFALLKTAQAKPQELRESILRKQISDLDERLNATAEQWEWSRDRDANNSSFKEEIKIKLRASKLDGERFKKIIELLLDCGYRVSGMVIKEESKEIWDTATFNGVFTWYRAKHNTQQQTPKELAERHCHNPLTAFKDY
jgi:hypothetical protein